MIFFPFVYNVTDVLFNVNARGSLVGGNGVTVGGVGSITGVASGVEFGTSVAAGVGTVGVGICWDQWFPETARCMAVQGAEILLYPTAIGSEPILNVDSSGHWQRVMQGHAAANLVPVAAANRIGTETVMPCEENGGQSSSLTFYGSSFIADATGELVASAGRDTEEILYASFDLDALREERFSWGLFRDRRPETYRIMTKQ